MCSERKKERKGNNNIINSDYQLHRQESIDFFSDEFLLFCGRQTWTKKLTKTFCNCKMCIPNLQCKMSFSSLKNFHYCKSKKKKKEREKSERKHQIILPPSALQGTKCKREIRNKIGAKVNQHLHWYLLLTIFTNFAQSFFSPGYAKFELGLPSFKSRDRLSTMVRSNLKKIDWVNKHTCWYHGKALNPFKLFQSIINILSTD